MCVGKEKTQFKSGSIAEENGRKGGIASGESKRKTKTFREAMKALLECEVLDEQQVRALEAFGLEPTYLNQIGLANIKKAAAGDTEAARFVRDTCGEKPREGIELGNLDDKPLSYLDMSKLTDEQLRAIAAKRATE
jgi:hypothetical protein